MLVRISGRFQFLGLMTTAAALLATGVFSSRSLLGGQSWLAGVLAVVVFGFGLANYWVLGRHVVVLSTRVAAIEARINALAPGLPGVPRLLSWESEHQSIIRGGWLVMGLFGRRI